MSSSIATVRVATAGSSLEEAQDAERQIRPLRISVGLFLAISFATVLVLPDETRGPVQLLRWTALGFTCLLAFGRLLQSPLSRQGAAWLLSGFYAAGTVVYSIDIPATVLRSASFTALALGMFIGASLCYGRQTSRPHRLPGRIGVMLALMAVPSLVGFVVGSPAIFFHEAGLFRGVFGHANTLGAFAALWLVVGVGALDAKLTRHRHVTLAGIVAMGICVVASQSRAGFGASVIATFCYVLMTRPSGRLLVGSLLAGTLALGAFILLPYAANLATRESTDFIFKGNEDDLLISRREVWETGWDNFAASPWFGHGFGTSVGEELKEWKIVGLGGREKGSAFIAALEETGVVGALFLCLPLGICVFSGFRLKRLNLRLRASSSLLQSDARLAAAFWAGAMGGIANNLAEGTLWSPGSPFGGMLLFLAGAAEGLMIRTEGRL